MRQPSVPGIERHLLRHPLWQWLMLGTCKVSFWLQRRYTVPGVCRLGAALSKYSYKYLQINLRLPLFNDKGWVYSADRWQNESFHGLSQHSERKESTFLYMVGDSGYSAERTMV